MGEQVATTQWSQVLAARDGTDTAARRALESICQTYWRPLYAYIRHQGYDPEEASDLTQGFFTEFMEKDLLAGVDPAKGRFRAFLLASLRHFLSHERKRARALKRGGGQPTLSFDVVDGESWYLNPASAAMTPEALFEHRWALMVLDQAMARLGEESRQAGTWKQFEILRPILTSIEPELSYEQAAQELEMSPGAVRTAVHRLRKRLARCLRAEVAATVATSDEVDDEVRHLLAAVKA